MSKLLRCLLAVLAFAAIGGTGIAYAQDGVWRRVETEHFVLYGRLSDARMRDGARDLEHFDALLRTLLPPSGNRPDGPKLGIYLFETGRSFRDFTGAGGMVQGFYTSRPELVGAFAIYDRSDQAGIDGQQVLFHEYTHHYMLQHFPDAYPSWFVEGFAEYMMTAQFREDEALIGFLAEARNDWLQNNWLSTEEIIGPQLRERRTRRANGYAVARFYAQSWAMTHYLMSDPARREAMWRYLEAVAGGADPVESFEPIIGVSPSDFRQQVRRYTGNRLPVFQVHVPAIDESEYQVTTLPAVMDLLLLAEVDLRAAKDQDEAREYLPAVREEASRYGDNPYAKRVLASAEIRTGNWAAGREILRALLAGNPEDGDAHYLMGLSYVLEAEAGDSAAFTETAAQGRADLLAALRANPQNTAAAYYLFKTYKQSQRPLPNEALNALLRAHLLAPQVRAIGVDLGTELMYAGHFPEAAAVLGPIANAPHESRMSRRAAQLLEAAQRNELPPPEEEEETADEEGD